MCFIGGSVLNLDRERCFAEIDLEALKENYIKIKKKAACPTYAVIKADAYGHGSIECAKALSEVGCDGFCVATGGEAVELREAGIKGEILILGAVPPAFMPEILKNDITVSLPSLENAKAYAEFIPDGKIKAHIKLDTGMSRHGITASEKEKACEEIEKIIALNKFDVEGIFSHLCVADMPDGREFTLKQTELFASVTEELSKRGINLKRHLANSAGIEYYPEAHFDCARAGIILYGLNFPDMENVLSLKPVMTLKAKITQIKHLKKGDTVGYGRKFTCQTDTSTATVSIGYADGLLRSASSKMSVFVNGKKVPQIGNICMDISMIDVTDVPDVKIGDEVTIFGPNAPLEDLAESAGTITYEILTGISKRVPRFYK